MALSTTRRKPDRWDEDAGVRHIARYLADVNGGHVKYMPSRKRTWQDFLWTATLFGAGAMLAATAVSLTRVVLSWMQ